MCARISKLHLVRFNFDFNLSPSLSFSLSLIHSLLTDAVYIISFIRLFGARKMEWCIFQHFSHFKTSSTFSIATKKRERARESKRIDFKDDNDDGHAKRILQMWTRSICHRKLFVSFFLRGFIAICARYTIFPSSKQTRQTWKNH